MRVEYVAASARGPLHAELGTGNQDAWKAASVHGGFVIAVADGMGSKPMAAAGSRTACSAAVAATELWWRTVDPPAHALPELIESLWRLWLRPVSPDDARSTCLVAGVSNRGSLVVAALGDGLALVASDQDRVDMVTPERSGFGNETEALGSASTTSSWHVIVRPQISREAVVMLATDGVADDLLPDRRASFAREVVASFGCLPAVERGVALWRALHEWPTPGHSDDKTVAVLWRPE